MPYVEVLSAFESLSTSNFFQFFALYLGAFTRSLQAVDLEALLLWL
jgi:hypothetical protein